LGSQEILALDAKVHTGKTKKSSISVRQYVVHFFFIVPPQKLLTFLDRRQTATSGPDEDG
jgi:hypothetical protein